MKNNTPNPPKFARWIFERFANSEDKLTIAGDLDEFFSEIAAEKCSLKAKIWYWMQIFNAIPVLLKNSLYWKMTILMNNMKYTVRSMSNQKVFSFINISGLAIGLAACIIIFQFVAFEVNYDNFHEKGNQIYRVRYDAYSKGKLQYKSAAAVTALGPALKNEFAEVVDFARISINWGAVTVSFKNPETGKAISFRKENVRYADASFLTMFSFPLIAGDAATALCKPRSILFSESTAQKYFGTENILFRTVAINGQDFKVTGVFKDVHPNSHIKFDVLMDVVHFRRGTMNDWHWDDFYTYIQLDARSEVHELESKIPELIQKHSPHTECQCFLQPLQDIHLYSHLQVEAEPNGNGNVVHFLSIVALIILTIAWVNYINLTSARALDRAKETGLRKVAGATRMQLIRQFLVESLLTNLVSAIIALVLVLLVRGFFESQTGTIFSFSFIINTDFGWLLLFFFLAGILITGVYPATLISSFNLVTVLKGQLHHSPKGLWLRKGLVVFQFVASIALITGTMFVHRQLAFMRNHDLGMDIDRTLVVRGPQVVDSTYNAKYASFKNELLAMPEIENVSASIYVPGVEIDWTRGIRRVSDDPGDYHRVFNLGVDENFVEVYGLNVLSGRKFSKEFGGDELNVMLNRSAAELLGFGTPDEAINQKLTFGSPRPRTVVGVVEDYFHLSLKSIPGPFVFHFEPNAREYYSTKINSSDLKSTIPKIDRAWSQFFPGNPFEYFFLDEFFDRQYVQDKKLEQTFGLFSLLAVFIACLGLFGLSSFATVQRTKEIGIRKVLGAGLISILYLFSKDFIKLVIVSAVITLPLCWIGLNYWLQSYPYRTEIRVGLFVLPFLVTAILAFLTVAYQIYRIARTNPVESLRVE